jgi:hypothetical protein
VARPGVRFQVDPAICQCDDAAQTRILRDRRRSRWAGHQHKFTSIGGRGPRQPQDSDAGHGPEMVTVARVTVAAARRPGPGPAAGLRGGPGAAALPGPARHGHRDESPRGWRP